MKIARVLNVVAVLALVGAAVTVYRIKYDATMHSEHVAKLKRQIAQEKDTIAVLKAEWSFLARPDRIQAFAERHLELKPLRQGQTLTIASLPDRPAPVDEIGHKLEALGLMGADASLATDASGEAKKAAAAPAKKSTIAVKPTSQLKAPANRPAPQKPATPKVGQPLNITDFLRQNPGLLR